MKLSDYGLKEDWDFKEVMIFLPKLRTKTFIRDEIYFKVGPIVRELERRKLINGFHFIVHENLDLRLSLKGVKLWENLSRLENIVSRYATNYTINDWLGLDPKIYGGKSGVALCYNNLEYNSRLILGLLEADYEEDLNPIKEERRRNKMVRASFISSQWPHYLRAQYAIDNETEAVTDFGNFWYWTKYKFRYVSRSSGVRCFIRALKWGVLKR